MGFDMQSQVYISGEPYVPSARGKGKENESFWQTETGFPSS